ncbi:hypothetical protein ACHAXR_005241 [Thalassiosira sp. AJA248-18]
MTLPRSLLLLLLALLADSSAAAMNPSPLTVLTTAFLLTLPNITSQQQHCDASNDDQTCNYVTTPRRQLPEDFIDPCQDKNPNCSQWALEGECRNGGNPYYMLTECARSCSSCRPLGDGVEEDELHDLNVPSCVDEHSECDAWAKQGECSVNPIFMHHKCKHSCWRCVNVNRDRELGVTEGAIAIKLLYSKMDTGKQQLIRKITDNGSNPMTKEDSEMVISTIRQMDHYARHTMTDPSTDAKTRERCQNQFQMCAEWASRGMCLDSGQPHNLYDDDDAFNVERRGQDDIIFMMNMCPLACRMCDELESFHKCAGRRHPWAQPSFQSGQLHSFFEGKRVSANKWTEEYEPLFASYPNPEKEGSQDDPYVVIFKKFLSEEEADHMQSLISTIGWSDNPSRNTYAGIARCHDNDLCKNDDIYLQIMRRISSLTNSTMSHLEPMEMVHLHASTQDSNILQHNFEISSLWKPAGPRVLSLFMFLSNAGEGGGGELEFPHLDWLHIRPRKGMAVLWPNVMNDNVLESDPLTSYGHFPLRNGDESFFGSHVHVMLHNWTDANMRGCT